jgi:hypothetical protein
VADVSSGARCECAGEAGRRVSSCVGSGLTSRDKERFEGRGLGVRLPRRLSPRWSRGPEGG